CSGGELHNRLLAALLTFYLADFSLLFAQKLPAGDGAMAYGQAVIAAARWMEQVIQPL
ncbi:hydrogenase maturation protein HypF, partial [Klebsiella pneumoniae]|uniref:hydrogenase maturation protein HypF n=1 Tax=Klebsiella pneumoniae TaxID=573 RepID=UPI00272EF4DF